jgi:hypothetical protein
MSRGESRKKDICSKEQAILSNIPLRGDFFIFLTKSE